MINRRTVASAILCTVAMLYAVPGAAQTRWDLYTYLGITHTVALQLQQFGDEVKKRTNGDLIITVRPAGELPFKANEVLKITGEGQVQMAQALSLFITGSIPLTGVTGLPMFLRTPEEMQKAIPIIQKYVSKDFEKAGVKILYVFQWGPVNILGSGKPIRTPEDFAGRKLRTLSPQHAEMLKRLGASSVSLTTAEVPVALERGTIEGVLSTTMNIVGSKWTDFIKWGYLGDYHATDDYVIVNTAAYNKLSPQTRKALDEVAHEWGPKMTKAIQAEDATAGDILRTKYKMEINRMSKADADRMTERMKDYWVSWAEQQGPEGVAMFREIRAAVGK